MVSLSDQLEYLRTILPDSQMLLFRSDRDMQDFLERDYDRRLQLLQTEALIALANSLEKINVSES